MLKQFWQEEKLLHISNLQDMFMKHNLCMACKPQDVVVAALPRLPDLTHIQAFRYVCLTRVAVNDRMCNIHMILHQCFVA